MSLLVAGRRLKKIAVVDDDQDVRTSYSEALEDFGVQPVDVPGPFQRVGELFDSKLLTGCDAVITDLALRGTGYAAFDGGDIAVEGRLRKIPVVLCTAYADVNRKLTRSQRRRIPAVLPRASFSQSSLVQGLEKCVAEIDEKFTPDRRPWRTQVQVTDIDRDQNYVWVVVMGRSPDEKVGLSIDELPSSVQQGISSGKILHAKVNTGAAVPSDLYFDEWETK